MCKEVVGYPCMLESQSFMMRMKFSVYKYKRRKANKADVMVRVCYKPPHE